MAAHAFNQNTWRQNTGGYLWVRGQPDLQREFQNSRGCTEKLCLTPPHPTKYPCLEMGSFIYNELGLDDNQAWRIMQQLGG